MHSVEICYGDLTAEVGRKRSVKIAGFSSFVILTSSEVVVFIPGYSGLGVPIFSRVKNLRYYHIVMLRGFADSSETTFAITIVPSDPDNFA